MSDPTGGGAEPKMAPNIRFGALYAQKVSQAAAQYLL